MGIGKAIGSAALGGLTGGVGGLVSGAIGGLGSLMGIGRRLIVTGKQIGRAHV